MRVTKIYFPSVTVIRLVGEGVEPIYFTQIPTSGELIYPSEDVIIDAWDWDEALEEAKLKHVKVESYEI